jgi:PAS domain S-box-containing protein
VLHSVFIRTSLSVSLPHPPHPCPAPPVPPQSHATLSDSYFQGIVETVREPLLVLDEELRVHTANRSFYATFSVEPEHTQGRRLEELGHGQWRIPSLLHLLEHVIPEGTAVDGYEVVHEHQSDGRRIMLLNARRIAPLDGGPALVLLAMEDVTERKRADEERERLMEELRRSNAELERFAYVASHDLQEPLRMVASYTQLLARRYQGQLDERADRYIGFAVEGATRMQALINGLLAYSRVGSGGEPVPVPVRTALDGALANLQAAVSAAQARVTHDALPVVQADPVQLLQLFQNLLGNALKFRGPEPPRVHVTAWRQGAWWHFRVSDNGIGIPAEYAERVFVLFQRLHSRALHPGTGMGLAICRKIVERHGGRIWVEPAEGGGSSFLFTLPAIEDA